VKGKEIGSEMTGLKGRKVKWARSKDGDLQLHIWSGRSTF